MKKLYKLIAGMGAFALIFSVSACSSSESGSGDSGNETAGGGTDKIILDHNCEPQNALIPGNTGETCGGKVLDLTFAGLVRFDEQGQPVNEVAESIETTDNKVWTIKIKDGQTFSDGTPVDADSFINAWNFTANGANAQQSNFFFEVLDGYAELNPGQDEGESDDAFAARVAKLAGKTLKGLEKIDDSSFKVTLTEPSVTFKIRLGYTSFFPLPKVAFDAEGKVTKEFGEKPVGNGPYDVTAWDHNSQISVRPSTTYKGGVEVKNAGIDFKIYAGDAVETAVKDVAGNTIDTVYRVPSAIYKGYATNEDISWNESTSVSSDAIEIPYYLEHFGQDEEGALRRQAISYAIDRQTIRDKIGDGTGKDSVSFCPAVPTLSGCDAVVPGSEVFGFDEAKAKELWAKAEAISPWADATLDLWYNGDSGGKPNYEAIANSYVNVLGIKGEAKATPDFKTLLTQRYAFEVKGAYRSGWQADYPSIENFLVPLYQTGASSNTSKYSNPEFDALLLKAAAAKDLTEANKLFLQAETDYLIKDLPAIFLGDGITRSAVSTSIDPTSVSKNWKGVLNYNLLVTK